jgi:hypothetical protein
LTDIREYGMLGWPDAVVWFTTVSRRLRNSKKTKKEITKAA